VHIIIKRVYLKAKRIKFKTIVWDWKKKRKQLTGLQFQHKINSAKWNFRLKMYIIRICKGNQTILFLVGDESTKFFWKLIIQYKF